MQNRLFQASQNPIIQMVKKTIHQQFDPNKATLIPFGAPNFSPLKHLTYAVANRHLGHLNAWKPQLLAEARQVSSRLLIEKKSHLNRSHVDSVMRNSATVHLTRTFGTLFERNPVGVIEILEMIRLQKSYQLTHQAQEEATHNLCQEMNRFKLMPAEYSLKGDGFLADATLKYGAGDCLAHATLGAAFLQTHFGSHLSIKLSGPAFYHHYFLMIENNLIWDPWVGHVYVKKDAAKYMQAIEQVIFPCAADDAEVMNGEKKHYEGDDKAPLGLLINHYELGNIKISDVSRKQLLLASNQSSNSPFKLY